MLVAVRGGVIGAVSILVAGSVLAQSGQRDSLTAHKHAAPASQAALDSRIASLLATTREASAEFRDRRTAIAAGYRRVGPDVPSMGEHWISPRLILADSFDVTRPALLTYIRVGGRPVLAGVVYAAPLAIGQSPPVIFGSDALWHEHNGTVDAEALLPDHKSAPSGARGTRLAILHAWLWSPNPGGIFATENWTIPFLRLELSPPRKFPIGAARALSLLSDAEEYYLNLAGPSAATVVAPVLSDCAKAAARIVERARTSDRVVRDDEAEELSRAWIHAISAIARLSGVDVATRMNGGRMP